MNLFAVFYKFVKSRLSVKIPENLQQIFVNNERLQKQIIEKDYLFLMIRDNFYFLKMYPPKLMI